MIKEVYLYLLIKMCVGFVIDDSLKDNIVLTDKGYIQPELLETIIMKQSYLSFQGIPYAKAPIGKLRFKPPVEVDPWEGIFVADKRDIKCVQKDQATFEWQGVEDCLILNVYTPELNLKNPSNLRAVLVWFHGGSFKSGNGGFSYYGPDHFMEEDVVLVSSNYRLGPFGFMALNHPDAVGNNGLKDQNMVLKWVQKNILNFAGDPKNVVIFGESAGATSVDFHVLSDMSKGLFHKSISMSGSPFCPWSFMTPYKSERQAFHLGKLLNDGKKVESKEELLQILYNKSALEIMHMTEEMSKYVPAFLPSIENIETATNEEKFITECYLSRYASGNYSKLPHLMGFTSNEALIFSKALDDFLKSEQSTIQEVDKINSNYPSLSIFGQLIVNLGFYLFDTSTWATNELLRIASDILFYVGIDMKQRIMIRTENNELYYYRISYDGKMNSFHQMYLRLEILQGTSHADDVYLLFYPRVLNFTIVPGSQYMNTVNKMVRLWCNFAKYSNPTPYHINDPLLHVNWPLSNNSGTYLEIGNKLSVKYTRPVDENVDEYEKENLESIIHSKRCFDHSFMDALKMNPLKPTEFFFNFIHQLIVNC